MTDTTDARHLIARRAARLEAILENAVDPILVMDDQGTIEFVNPAMLSLFGYTLDEVMGKNVKMLVPPCDEERGSDMPRSAGTDKPKIVGFGREVLGQRKDGSTFPMEFAVSEATIDGRRYLTGIVHDLSERWEEASFGRVIEDSLNEIFIFDARTWRFLQVNRGARENLGFSLQELREMTTFDIQPEMTPDSFARLIHPLIIGKKSKLQFETVHNRKDGSSYFVEVHLQRSTYRGRPVFVAIILDITERRGSAELLRVQQRAMEAASSGILITDSSKPDNPIVTCNRAFLEITGYTADEVMSLNCRFLQRDDRDQEAIDELRDAVAEGKDCHVLVRNYRKDGTMFWNDLRVSPVRDDYGRVTHFVGILADVTQREKREDALKAIIRETSAQLRATETELVNQARLAALGQTFGGIAHEIRTPLNALKTSAYYLRNARRPAPVKTREHLMRIDRQVKVIDEIVTALSNMVSLPAPELNPAALGDWVPQAAGEIELPCNVDLSIELPPELPEVLVDITQVPIVLKNLIRNARDAMPNGGSITISAQACNGFVGIMVADCGEGISEDVLPEIMKPLFSTKPRGMGLGLTISRAIIEKNQGRIEVQSKVGEGTIFTIYFQSAPPASRR